MLREIKNRDCHYFKDEFNYIWGEFKTFHINGELNRHANYHNGARHGEHKRWNIHKRLIGHIYYVNDKMVHDFLLNPISDEEKMLLVLRYGGKLLPKED